MSAPGALIADRYRLVNLVGTGGMGVVWEAWDERLHRTVALKQLHPQPGLSAAETELANNRAMREARITARLHHPQAVPVFDVVEHDGRPCLVMQFLPSKRLSTVLRARSVLPLAEVARIGAQVASALAAAHEVGIVHRDVKPGNILLTEDGTARISDFGISHALGDATLTSTGMVTGTPAYLAPEVARGGASTPASDVFSLGATLYTAMEGMPPFGTDQNPMALLHRVASGHPVPPRHSSALTPLILAMLSPEPSDRPSMKQVAAELSNLASRHGAGTTGATPTVALTPGSTGNEEESASTGMPTIAITSARSTSSTPQAVVAIPPTAPPASMPVPTPEPAPEPAPVAGPVSAPLPPQASVPVSRPTPAPTPAPNAATGSGSWPPWSYVSGETAAPEGSRSRAAWLVLALALLVGAAVLLALLPGRGGGGPPVTAPRTGTPTASSPASSTSPSASPSSAPSTRPASPSSAPRQSSTRPSQTPSSTPRSSPTTAAPAAPPARSPTGRPTTAQLSQAITSYYSLMPGNTDAAWARMTPAYQRYHAGGRAAYQRFWDAISSVSVSNVSAAPPSSVVADLTYVYRDGRVVRERTSYGLVQDGGILKIASSSVLSSHTR